MATNNIIIVVFVLLCMTSIKFVVVAADTGATFPQIPSDLLDTSRGILPNAEQNEEPTSVKIESTIQPSTRNLIENETNDVNQRNLPELSIFKRAPSGFMGMRGKKEYEEYPEYNNRMMLDDMLEYYHPLEDGREKKLFLQGINRGLLLNSPIPKRAPSGFVGMRGKKANEATAGGYKRVPQAGFFGVRGKKSNSNSANIYNLVDELLRESELDEDYEPDYESEWENLGSIKRTPALGFVGMRGKRYQYQLVGNDDEFEKRAPTGFMGMRGRRSFNNYENGVAVDMEKRQPNGFFGVRGKKSMLSEQQLPMEVEELGEEQDEDHQRMKKAVLSQFFGTRGKKEIMNSGFFGTRGKKQPFEFRGKFVGVRGKKDFTSNSLQRLETQLKTFDIPEQIASNGEQMKRAPNGFQGMRGKKGSE